MNRDNHYERALADLLLARRTPFVAVDETRRSWNADSSLKSLDFIVYSQRSPHLLVDVKGRRFPTGTHRWENWATDDDLASLLQWEATFGSGFRSALVFAYDVVRESDRGRFAELHEYRARSYAFFAVWASDFAQAMSTRSPKWKTVSVAGRDYAGLRIPISRLL